MKVIRSLDKYQDESGNIIESDKPVETGIEITFRGGKNNRVVVPAGARVAKLTVSFDGDNGLLVLGNNFNVGPMNVSLRIGQDSQVHFGDDFSTTDRCVISAVEGTKVVFGNDVMIASGNEFRADDGHPIFDVRTGKRVNVSKDITIGHHVWFARGAAALGGSVVGDGSVIGFESLVTGRIPNNVVAVGSPAKVVRRDIAWERPHLSLKSPPYKPDASTVVKSAFWNLTVDGDSMRIHEAPLPVKTSALLSLRRKVWHFRKHLRSGR